MAHRRTIRIIFMTVLLAAAVGCRHTDCDKVYAHWFWEDAEGTKAHFDGYKHVVLVRVDEDVLVDGGQHRLSMHHFKGTVVQSYKGEWNISEPIAFVQGLDYSTASVTNRRVGNRMVLLTNEHTTNEFGIDTGDSFSYDGDFKRVLQCYFHPAQRK